MKTNYLVSIAMLLIACSTQTTVAARLHKRDYTKRSYFTLHTLYPNDIESARQAANHLGAQLEGPVGELSHYYWISIPMTMSNDQHDVIHQFNMYKNRNRKRDVDLVDTIQAQIPKKRLYKRAPPPKFDPIIENKDEEHRLNGGGPIMLPSLDDNNGFQKMKEALNIKDPGFDKQWHLINREERGHDVNITGVWSQGITGENIVVAILDDGLEMDHEDLKENYFAEGSYDFNDHVPEPKPRLPDDTHGTRCAGEIAAAKNDVCGMGVAYNAKVAGIRILSSEITEADEAMALNYEYQKNHIYSCSWGPPDMGEVAEAPRGIILDAIKNGIRNGRNGTGSIFVFASGNGGANDDNCNFDGYTNSLYTVTVGAIDKLGNHPYYSEKCAAQLVVTYSSGSGGYIYTTDIGVNECSDRHGGTSAAAPLAAGVFALVLSVRPELTWRDIQHLCVQSAIPISLEDDDWSKLPSGRMFNHKYGYGVLDAYGIVELAKTFKSVRPQTRLEVLSEIDAEQRKIDIPDITPFISTDSIDKTKAFTSTLMVTNDMIKEVGLARLEHVTATVNIEHDRRGDLEILLESPHGVLSQLGAPRQFDKSKDGLLDWTFMTVKHWEEDPVGNWTLHVIDGKHPESTGKFIDWKLTLWGEVADNFSLPPEIDDGKPSIGVDDFETGNESPNDDEDSNHNQSFVDQDEVDNYESKKPSTSFMVYSLVSLFMLASIGSTAFIVKKYMLNMTNIDYTRPTEDDTYEFDNLLNHSDDDDTDDDDDNADDASSFGIEHTTTTHNNNRS